MFDIQRRGDGVIVLLRLERPEPEAKLTRKQSLQAIADAPLHPKMDWPRLRELTREP